MYNTISSPSRQDDSDVDVVARDAGILNVMVHGKKEETNAKALLIAVCLNHTNVRAK